MWVGKRPARPQGLKPPIKLTPGGNKELTMPMEELLDQLVKSTNGVLLFMKVRAHACEFLLLFSKPAR